MSVIYPECWRRSEETSSRKRSLLLDMECLRADLDAEGETLAARFVAFAIRAVEEGRYEPAGPLGEL